MNKMNKIIMSETTRSKISFAPNGDFKTSFKTIGGTSRKVRFVKKWSR